MAEALERHSGPPISADEVLDFASWLAGATSVAEAAGNVRPPEPDGIRRMLDDAYQGRRPATVGAPAHP